MGQNEGMKDGHVRLQTCMGNDTVMMDIGNICVDTKGMIKKVA